MVIPVGWISLQSIGYLHRVGDELLDPNVPVVQDFKTPGGVIALRIDRYRITPESGRIEIWNASATAAGKRLAGVRNVQVSVANWRDSANLTAFTSPVVVRADGVFARIERDPDGKLALQRYFPPGESKPGQVPFRIQLTRAELVYEDQSVPSVPLRAATEQLVVNGIGDEWQAVGILAIAKVGKVRVSAQQLADKTIIATAESARLNGDALLAAGFSAQLPKDLGLDSPQISGRARLVIGKDGKFQVRAPITASLAALRYQKQTLQWPKVAGVLTENGFSGRVTAALARSRAEFDGTVLIQKSRTEVGGRLRATLASLQDVPTDLRRSLPKELAVNGGQFTGFVRFHNPKRWAADGAVTVRASQYKQENITNLAANVAANPSLVTVDLTQPVVWNGIRASGWGNYGLTSRQVQAVAAVAPFAIQELPKSIRPADVVGRIGATISVAGDVGKPAVFAHAEGRVAAKLSGRRVDFGSVNADIRYENGRIALAEGIVQGPLGLLTVVPAGNGKLTVDARGIQLAQLDKNLTGIANARGTIDPNLRSPQFIGRLETYRLAYQDQEIPVATADFSVDRTGLRIDQLHGLRGTSVVNGRGSYRFKDGRIAARANIDNFQASDLNEEYLIGTTDIRNILVSGSANNPRGSFEIMAGEIVAGGVKASNLSIPGDFHDGVLTIKRGRTSILGGEAEVSALYRVKGGIGRAEIAYKGMNLAEFGAEVSSKFTVSGAATGKVAVTLRDNRVADATSRTDFSGLVLNRAPFGAGTISAAYDGDVISADGSIGQIDRYISVSDVKYQPASRDISGAIAVSQLQAEDLAALAGPATETLTYDQRKLIDEARGSVSLGATVAGNLKDPSLKLDVLEATGLRVANTEFGTITLAGTRTPTEIILTKALLDGPVAKVSATGKLVKDGPISIDGEVRDLIISSLRAFSPSLATVAGKANIPFVVSGTTEKPELTASVETEGLLQKPGDPRDLALDISLDRVSISESTATGGGIDVGGVWKYRGFQGAITVATPLKFPFEIPETGQISAAVTLGQRPLKDIAELSDTLDPARTDGVVQGLVKASGTLEKINWLGNIDLTAPKLAMRGNDIQLQDVSVNALVNSEKASVKVSANHAGGGTLSGELATKSESLAGVFDKIAAGEWRSLLDSEISGLLTVSDFRHRQKFGAQSVSGRATGQISVSGPVRSPLVAGDLNLFDIDGTIPAIDAAGKPSDPPLIDPRFNVNVNLANPARLRAATADLSILGTVGINGKFTAPMVASVLTVEKGAIRLPGGLIRIGQGGSVRFDYVGGQEVPPSLVLDVDGRTSVVTAVTGTSLERYDVLISITGDLLKEGGLNFEATSDPPGLSQDRIIGLLGQTDLLSTFGSDTARSDSRKQIGDAFTSFAIPVVFERLTEGLAQSLELDYITVDYNAFDRVSLVAARTLGSGFSLQGRRQISTPEPGQPVKYDVRLVYRPRRIFGILSRFNFSVGSDETRPIKLSMDYSARFGRAYEGRTKGPTSIFPPPKK